MIASNLSHLLLVLLVSWWFTSAPPARAESADLILHHGKVITVDKAFSIAEAVAVKDGKILAVGGNDAILKLAGQDTQTIDLKGRTLLPGLMDSHTHAPSAAMHEFDHEIPSMESIQDVLDYVKARAAALDDGEWIMISQVFITRLNERRYPTRAELDAAAPKNPVVFSTGPDASLNSLALKLSGIDKNYKVPEGRPGKVERDASGEPTGILRNLGGVIKSESPKSVKHATEEDRYKRLLTLFKDYNAVGLTAIADRDCPRSNVDRYQRMLDNGELSVRVACSRSLGAGGSAESISNTIRSIAKEPQCQGGPMLRIVGLKLFLDGGMLTGSARLLEPWGVSSIYSIDDPTYKGVFRTDPAILPTIVRTAVENNLQFTAHSVGDGAVQALAEAYAEVDKTLPVRKTRPCITHCNFMSDKAIDLMAKHGIVADIQPVWLYLDVRTLSKQFDYDRLHLFQPLRTLFNKGIICGGGSDHMQKIGSMRSVNPYNPWLGMWTAITRRPRDYDNCTFHPEQCLTREQAIRFYTINNAYILFLDDVAGSLEQGKFADMIVIDRDILTCPVDDIKDTKVLRTYLAGKLVHQAAE